MKRFHTIKLGLCILGIMLVLPAWPQDYNNASQLAKRLRNLANASGAASLKSLTKTPGGKDIWMLTLGTGDMENKPAIAVVGGVEGKHLLGVEMAVRFAEDIVNNNLNVLDKTTCYVFPNMSPDATEQYFSPLKYERSGNAKDTDDDRDGRMNEDPFEDLNGDGMITMMRILDKTGDWITHPADDRVMIRANKSKGEKGKYRLFTEGRDNDKDGQFNEDGPGGIHFNKSLTFAYDYFKQGVGEHPVSEPENRALLDELYTHWNIYAFVTFGPGNNLSSPWNYNQAGANSRITTSVLKGDQVLNKLVSEEYNKVVKTKDSPPSVEPGGNFNQWAYFHFGRLSFSTPVWWTPMIKGDSTMKENTDKNREVNFLRWAAQQDLPNYFADWAKVTHPDFPGQQVEVGGIVPYKMLNPPIEIVDSLADKHNEFIRVLASMQAELSLINVKTETAGKGLTRITVDLYNSGSLPTHTEMGQKSRWLRKIKLELKTGNGQSIVSGRKTQLIPSISGDDSQSFTWLIRGKGSISIKAGAPHTGFISTNLNLK